MKIAFYAPMKAPSHPVPSGDRTLARGLVQALIHAGYQVEVASELRCLDKAGDAAFQARCKDMARAETDRILARPEARGWGAWVTYHNFYKAPDLVGPAVSRALGLPYIAIEATRARKRLTGPWAAFAAAAEAACDQAHAIFYFTEQDAFALRRDAPAGQTLHHLPPFLARTDLPAESRRAGPILAVGMMRPGDKLASYRLIAETLGLLDDPDWRLDIIGDGPARAQAEALFDGFGQRVTWRGALEGDALEAAYANASCLFWPGVNEAVGMTYLEALAAGLPIVAQDRPGLRDVVPPPRAPVDDGAPALATRLRALCTSLELRESEGRRNRARIAAHHLLPAAAERLDATLRAL